MAETDVLTPETDAQIAVDSDARSPRLTVLLPAMLGVDTIPVVIEAWRREMARHAFTLLILCPDPDNPAIPREPGIEVLDVSDKLLHEARAAAVRAAKTPFVLLAEDHCVPERGAMKNVLEALTPDATIFGPIIEPGWRLTPANLAACLIGYGEWMAPLASDIGPLPGHNSIVRRDLFLSLEPHLEESLLVCSFAMKKIQDAEAGGRRLAGWRMRHFDVPGLVENAQNFWYVGLSFGAVRTQALPAWQRVGYSVLFPIAIARHWARGALQYQRVARENRLGISTLFAMVPFAVLWGVGEAVGAIRGLDSVRPYVWRSEVKPAAVPDHALA